MTTKSGIIKKTKLEEYSRPRSNGIIEAGGLILQSRQIDSTNIWRDLENRITFKNFNDLEAIINKLLNNEGLSNDILFNIFKNFKDSKNLIEKSLDQIFKDI